MSAANPAVSFLKASRDIGPATKATGPERGPDLRREILLIGCLRDEHLSLGQILMETPWHLGLVGTCREAGAVLARHPISVIVCERDLPDGTWRDILALIAGAIEPPKVIVTSRLADEHLWAEVLNVGGFDVLAKPFRAQEVRHVLSSAGNQLERQNISAAGPN